MLLALTQAGAIRLAVNAGNNSAANSSINLNGCLLKLINNSSIALNGNTLWSQVSGFIGGSDGYSDATLTFNAPSLSDANVIETWSTASVFTQSGSASPQNYAGIVITDPGSASVYFACPFDNPPVPFLNTLSRLTIVVRYSPLSPNASIVAVIV